ncbi:MAG: protein kinase [Proteobacteria bacterium]|nr:protein kinase [Pseudomonadota bacterium]
MPRILLIDDSADYRKRLIRYINNAHSNIEVVEYDPISQRLPGIDFKWDDYNLVILDYNLGLGKENGLGWMVHFDSIANMPPVIMLTVEDNTKVAVRVLKVGAIDFIEKKDVSAETIKATLDAVFELADKKRSLIANQAEAEKHVDAEEDTIEVKAPLPELLFQEENDANVYDHLHTTDDQIKRFGFLVPGYKLLKEIGRSGMSTVLLAQPDEEDKEVVLKVMFTKGHEDPLALKRFMQEYTLISCLDHPNVVRIFERAFAADFAYIAMEYFPVGDLTKKLAAGIKLDFAIEYIRQMCMGLVAVHDLNVVHRDIKPGNILFRNDGTLTITDFGAAKNLTGDVADITVNNQIVGTPYYMSPEQGTGMAIDHRSNLYSLGILIYQMLTNERPYTAKSVAQLISMHLNAPIPRLPDDLAKYQPLIDGLLAKDPDERFQSANDVILGLDWIN